MLEVFEVKTLSYGNAWARPIDRIFSESAIAIPEYAENHEASPISMLINA
jgi:hypothetical protein